MTNAFKIIAIIISITTGVGTFAHMIPESIAKWVILVSVVLHQAAHTIGDMLDDGQLNDSYKDGK